MTTATFVRRREEVLGQLVERALHEDLERLVALRGQLDPATGMAASEGAALSEGHAVSMLRS